MFSEYAACAGSCATNKKLLGDDQMGQKVWSLAVTREKLSSRERTPDLSHSLPLINIASRQTELTASEGYFKTSLTLEDKFVPYSSSEYRREVLTNLLLGTLCPGKCILSLKMHPYLF